MAATRATRDTKLGRDVAIKALFEGIQHDAERLSRFEREARRFSSSGSRKPWHSSVFIWPVQDPVNQLRIFMERVWPLVVR